MNQTANNTLQAVAILERHLSALPKGWAINGSRLDVARVTLMDAIDYLSRNNGTTIAEE